MAMTKEWAAELKPLVDAIVGRAEGLQMKGKKRDEMALNMLMGAYAVTGQFDKVAFIVSILGYSQVVEMQTEIDKTLGR